MELLANGYQLGTRNARFQTPDGGKWVAVVALRQRWWGLSRCDNPARAERAAVRRGTRRRRLGRFLRRPARRYSSQRDEFHLQRIGPGATEFRGSSRCGSDAG